MKTEESENKKSIFPIILIILMIIIGIFIITSEGNKIYYLNNGSKISKSEVLSFKDQIVSEYNKMMERSPPKNKELYYFFFLNKSFDSTIQLSYYGNVGFYFIAIPHSSAVGIKSIVQLRI